MNGYQQLREALRVEFNARYDKQSSVLRLTLGRDEYNIQRALCFEWYLSGFFDGAGGDELREALEDAAKGRTTPIDEVRAKLGKGSETIH